MTPITPECNVPVAIAPRIDRALGPEAATLREHFRVVYDPHPSVALGQSWVAIYQRIFDLVVSASLENGEGNGAAPVQPTTLKYALAFSAALPATMPLPELWVDRDGEIAFDWDCGARRYFSVRVGRDGTLTYAGLFGHAKSHGVESFSDTIPAPVFEGIRRTVSKSSG